jgi:predicted transcriptional regulator
MRTTKTLSITLPPEMLARAEELAKREHRTMSELVREALRRYDRAKWWEDINAYGQRTAEAAGIGEADVAGAVREVREARSMRSRNRRRAG